MQDKISPHFFTDLCSVRPNSLKITLPDSCPSFRKMYQIPIPKALSKKNLQQQESKEGENFKSSSLRLLICLEYLSKCFLD